MDSFYTNIGPRRGIAAWMLSTDHKKIGIMYLAALLSFFSVGTLMGVLMRLNLISPGTFMGAQTYNRLFTIHGIVQIFLFIIPGIPVSFGNFFLPIMIGARDVAFPRINRLSWWLYLAGACLMLASLFFGGSARYRVDVLRALQHPNQDECIDGGICSIYPRVFLHTDGHQFCDYYPPAQGARHDVAPDAPVCLDALCYGLGPDSSHSGDSHFTPADYP